MGYGGLKTRMTHADAVFEPSEDAQRYEALTLYPPSVEAFGTSLAWIAEEVGWEWAYRRIHALGQHCYDALAQIDGVTMYLPKDAVAGLVHFRLNDIAPADLTARLAEQGVLIRHTPDPQLNRVSTGFYNTEAEIDRLVQAINEVRGA